MKSVEKLFGSLIIGAAFAAALGCTGCASETKGSPTNQGNTATKSTSTTGAPGTPAPPASPSAGHAGAASTAMNGGAGSSVAPAPSPGASGSMRGTGGAPAAATTGGSGGAPLTGPSSIDPSTGLLIAPASGKGVQITTTEFVLMPGQEVFRCFHAEVPIDGEIDVARFESLMSDGSHHFILYRNDGDTTPSGTLTNSACTLGFDQRWIYSSGTVHFDLTMPDGVAMVLSSRQRVVFDMHYINRTQQPINAKVVLNINLAQGTFEKAAALVSFNRGISIPPNGMQTVGGDCTPGAGSKFFIMSTHTHKRGILSTITRVMANGQAGEELVRSPDWEHPSLIQWGAPGFLTFQTGEKFHYSCTYQNDRASTVTVGSSAENNEMCMAVTYFFPASAGGTCN